MGVVVAVVVMTTMSHLILLMTALGNRRMLLVNREDGVTLTTLLTNQQPLTFLFDDSFKKQQNNLMTQPRSLVTELENLALVMIVVNARVAKEAAKHEKMKMLPKHLKRFLHFDVLLEEMVEAERDLTQQFLTGLLTLQESLVKLFLEQ